MPRKLKVFRMHLGFYDAIVAAPSQKAALKAWGAGPQQFSQGFASISDDPDIVAAALEKPDVVLRRQFGSKGKFAPEPERLRAPKVSNKKAAAAARQRKKRESASKAKEARQEMANTKKEEADALREIDRRISDLEAEKKDVRA